MLASVNLRKILVTTDLSSEADRPLRAVAELARKYGARLELLHVVEDIAVGPEDPLAPPVHLPGTLQELKQVRALLEEKKQLLGPGLEVSVQAISAASVPRAIAKHASEHGFDLIALSTHGRGGFRRLVLGSVAETVLRHASVPVLVFPRQE
jgi:nucleotide-binding universal stress UspA family protein